MPKHMSASVTVELPGDLLDSVETMAAFKPAWTAFQEALTAADIKFDTKVHEASGGRPDTGEAVTKRGGRPKGSVNRPKPTASAAAPAFEQTQAAEAVTSTPVTTDPGA